MERRKLGSIMSKSDIIPTQSRKLHLASCRNVRELGGYPTPCGSTQYHRFLRAGSTRSLITSDIQLLKDWGVARALDLRSTAESPRVTCTLSRQTGIAWKNVPLYDIDVSAPTMMPAHGAKSYLVSSYLQMLAVTKSIKRAFEFLAQAQRNECVLFHCAAGMDRTGVISLLLLGLCGVPKQQILADYAYSFGPTDAVNLAVEEAMARRLVVPASTEPGYLLAVRIQAIEITYDTIVQTHGSVRNYLASCDVGDQTLDAVSGHLLQP